MIFSVPFSQNLTEILQKFITDRFSTSPAFMASAEVILPSARACHSLKNAFIKNSGGRAFLLPKISALYQMNNLFTDSTTILPTAQRILLLSKLCRPLTDDDYKALKIAISLSELLDECYQYEVDLSQLNNLAEKEEFSIHWNETLRFLDIIQTHWPNILKELNKSDPMQRNIFQIRQLAKKLKENPPKNPVIFAGFDIALPSVTELAGVINSLPNGFLFLQGLNTTLTEQEWKKLEPNHIQYGFKQFLEQIKCPLSMVQSLGKELTNREKALHLSCQEHFNIENKGPINSLQEIKRIYCDTEEKEATTIALLLRKTLETPEKTAALITANRKLARRVIVEMQRWNVLLDDSAGISFSETLTGQFLSLIAELGKSQNAPPWLLALLKHPLFTDGKTQTEQRIAVKKAEKNARKNQTAFSFALNTDLSHFFSLFTQEKVPFKDILTEHITVAEALATSEDKSGATRLWDSEEGKTAYPFLTELLTYADTLGLINPLNYPDILLTLLKKITIRPLYGMHPRLDILGPIEARFADADVCILGGVNEGSIPPIPDTGAWLNRTMRKKLNLPAPEESVAASHRDFCRACAAKEVYITRSEKEGGSPALPSRFLLRLEALAEIGHTQLDIYTPHQAFLLTAPQKNTKITRPAPNPPTEARPTLLSVTEIGTLLRDPYAIYAKRILKLKKLPSLNIFQKSQLYGSVLHKLLEENVNKNPVKLNAEELTKKGVGELLKIGFTEADMAFFKPKMNRLFTWVDKKQQERQLETKKIFTELSGKMDFAVAHKTFTLTVRADRIDLLTDNTVDIIDYKTGRAPNNSEVKSGQYPQLPLEAIILLQGGFSEIPVNAGINKLLYWQLKGKKTGAEEIHIAKKDVNQLIETTYTGFKNLIEYFENPVPYECCPVAKREPKFNDYAHLERLAEWKNAEGDSE